MAAADFYLGEGDTAPPLLITCRDRATPADPDGALIDLTGATLAFELVLEDPPEDYIPVAATAAASGDPTLGVAAVNWVDGYDPGRYLGRLKVTTAGGAKLSFPPDRHLLILVTEDP